MKHTLSYGRITLAYEDFDPKVPCRPSPLFTFAPVRINGKLKHPIFTDKVAFSIIKYKALTPLTFREAYIRWYCEGAFTERDLGEGRAFYRWLYNHQSYIQWKPQDFKLHAYFTQGNAPKHDPGDELAHNHSFAIKPVEINKRKVKLYLEDAAILNLITMPYGEDDDFMNLVEEYVRARFQWEKWRAPAPTFLDWIKARGSRPVFSSGQLGLSL
jgi:hypothetical protein